MDLLAQEIVSHTPDRLHWAEGTTFKWVLFPSAPSDELSALRDKVRGLLEERYVVYPSPDQVPEERRVRGELGVSYRDGFEFTYSIRIVDKNTLLIDYQDYEAPLAASRQTVRYRWLTGRWHVMRQGDLMVS